MRKLEIPPAAAEYNEAGVVHGTQHRQHVDRSAQLGMAVEHVSDVDPVIECLDETQTRKGLSITLGSKEIHTALDLLGPENLRLYVCFDQQGKAASSCVTLHAPGARAIGLVAGTKATGLADGASHALWGGAFADLAAAGATGIDFCEADVQSVAAFKCRWGSRLVPTYTVRDYSLRATARFLSDWMVSRRL